MAADLSLNTPDYRCAERTFQLLTQAAGRAGRGSQPGSVVIQTYRPDHYSIETAARQDYEAFYSREIAYRRMMNYPRPAGCPPCCSRRRTRRRVEHFCRKASERISMILKGFPGPASLSDRSTRLSTKLMICIEKFYILSVKIVIY